MGIIGAIVDRHCSVWSRCIISVNLHRVSCATKRTRTPLGDRSFSVAGPCLWNSLPVALRDRDISLVQFKSFLTTLWFVWAVAHSDCCFFAPCTNIFTYLHKLRCTCKLESFVVLSWRNILSKLTDSIVWISSDSFHTCGRELCFSEHCCEYAMQLQWPFISTFKWVIWEFMFLILTLLLHCVSKKVTPKFKSL